MPCRFLQRRRSARTSCCAGGQGAAPLSCCRSRASRRCSCRPPANTGCTLQRWVAGESPLRCGVRTIMTPDRRVGLRNAGSTSWHAPSACTARARTSRRRSAVCNGCPGRSKVRLAFSSVMAQIAWWYRIPAASISPCRRLRMRSRSAPSATTKPSIASTGRWCQFYRSRTRSFLSSPRPSAVGHGLAQGVIDGIAVPA